MIGSPLDTALDLSVLGGYTSVGYRIRSHGWTALPRMEGKVMLITGATSGVGLTATDGPARLLTTVWLAVRRWRLTNLLPGTRETKVERGSLLSECVALSSIRSN
jgi:hypothetical protein